MDKEHLKGIPSEDVQLEVAAARILETNIVLGLSLHVF